MAFMTRISNNMIYGQNLQRLSTLQTQLNKTQLHISANTRILTPADDPVGAARALDLKQGKSMNTQFASNRGDAKDALNLQESILSNFGDRVQNIHTLLVSAGNAAYAEDQLRVTADEIRAIRDELVGYANTRDATGNYLFSGNQVGTQPFDQTAAGKVTYKGDDGRRFLQVDAARQMPVTDSGKTLFMGIKGTTASTVTPSRNDLMIDVDIKDETKLGDYTYKVTFTGDSPVSSYILERAKVSYNGDGSVKMPAYPADYTQIDADGNAPPVNPPLPAVPGTYPYTSTEKNIMEVDIDGIRFSITNEVSDGDTVDITPGKPVRNDIFAYINEAIDLLEGTSLKSDGASTNLALGLEALLANMASGLDQILTARGSAGTRLKELDALNTSGTDKDLLYTESISELEDLDYYKAISDLYMQQTTLQAAQQSFMMIQGMSLFNMM